MQAIEVQVLSPPEDLCQANSVGSRPASPKTMSNMVYIFESVSPAFWHTIFWLYVCMRMHGHRKESWVLFRGPPLFGKLNLQTRRDCQEVCLSEERELQLAFDLGISICTIIFKRLFPDFVSTIDPNLSIIWALPVLVMFKNYFIFSFPITQSKVKNIPFF